MKLGGLQKLTLIDYPGKIACTVFCLGCNFRCPWCYSSELVLPEKIKKQPRISEKDFFRFLKSKKGLIEGVVICGGEPCLQNDLPKFARSIKKMGYSVKLDTNGSNPQMLRDLASKKLIDYVAMDIKAPRGKYPNVAGTNLSLENIDKTIKFLIDGPVDYEFRTTLVPGFLDKNDILKIAKWISGAKKYFLQNFRPEKTLNPELEKVKPLEGKFLEEICKEISPYFKDCQIR